MLLITSAGINTVMFGRCKSWKSSPAQVHRYQIHPAVDRSWFSGVKDCFLEWWYRYQLMCPKKEGCCQHRSTAQACSYQWILLQIGGRDNVRWSTWLLCVKEKTWCVQESMVISALCTLLTTCALLTKLILLLWWLFGDGEDLVCAIGSSIVKWYCLCFCMLDKEE